MAKRPSSKTNQVKSALGLNKPKGSRRPTSAFSTLDERRAYSEWLSSLLERPDGRDLLHWKREVQVALGEVPGGARLAQDIDSLDTNEASLTQAVQTALSIVEHYPVASLGEIVEQRITFAADQAVFSRLKWWGAIFAVILFGGTVSGVVAVDGLVKDATKYKDQAIKDMQISASETRTEAETIKSEASKAHMSIDSARQEAEEVGKLSQKITSAQGEMKSLSSTVESSKAFAHALPATQSGPWTSLIYWWCYFLAPITWAVFAVFLAVRAIARALKPKV